MNEKTQRFLNRNGMAVDDIKYILRENQRTAFHLLDNRIITTVTPLKEVLSELPEGVFLNIQKGVAVCARHVVDISNHGVYTMTDGRTFCGRKRNLGEHKRNRSMLSFNTSALPGTNELPLTLFEKCTVLDEMPVAFCVIELVFDKDGHGIDFIFRYCNKEMEALEGVCLTDMIGRSFYEVFPDGDKKWLISYADVALNGTKRTIRDYNPEIRQNLTIHCFQPDEGFCACLLIKDSAAAAP